MGRLLVGDDWESESLVERAGEIIAGILQPQRAPVILYRHLPFLD